MSPERQQPHSEDSNAELAFVQQALAAADRSERSSRIIVGVLAILAVVVFIWMHLRMFPPETLGGLLHSILSSGPFLSGPPVRHRHVPSSGYEQEHAHHPSGSCEHTPALTLDHRRSAGRRGPLLSCFQLMHDRPISWILRDWYSPRLIYIGSVTTSRRNLSDSPSMTTLGISHSSKNHT